MNGEGGLGATHGRNLSTASHEQVTPPCHLVVTRPHVIHGTTHTLPFPFLQLLRMKSFLSQKRVRMIDYDTLDVMDKIGSGGYAEVFLGSWEVRAA